MTHIIHPELTSSSKSQTFKNPRWWTAAILKNVKCDSRNCKTAKIKIIAQLSSQNTCAGFYI